MCTRFPFSFLFLLSSMCSPTFILLSLSLSLSLSRVPTRIDSPQLEPGWWGSGELCDGTRERERWQEAQHTAAASSRRSPRRRREPRRHHTCAVGPRALATTPFSSLAQSAVLSTAAPRRPLRRSSSWRARAARAANGIGGGSYVGSSIVYVYVVVDRVR